MNTSSLTRKIGSLEKAKRAREGKECSVKIVTYWGHEQVDIPSGHVHIVTKWGSNKLNRDDEHE